MGDATTKRVTGNEAAARSSDGSAARGHDPPERQPPGQVGRVLRRVTCPFEFRRKHRVTVVVDAA
jgi:hypothetical protein